MQGGNAEKRMRLRYAGVCRVCGDELPARAEAIHDPSTRTVRCVRHDGELTVTDAAVSGDHDADPVTEPEVAERPFPEPVDSGTAGASARREYERRKAKREDRIRAKHPKLGGLMLAVSQEAQSTTAWGVGAAGEELLGRGLDRLAGGSVRLLHDRRIPGSRANIDHLAVTANGVVIIDAKKYQGRPHLKVDGGLLRPRVERLLVGSRDCTKLVDGVLKQVDVVRDLLQIDVPVRGILCFVEADWPLIGGAFTTRGVKTLWPKKLYSALQAEGPLPGEAIAEIHRQLTGKLRPS